MEVKGSKPLERDIYENAISRMETLGTKAILQPRLIEKRHAIKESLLDYYESTGSTRNVSTLRSSSIWWKRK